MTLHLWYQNHYKIQNNISKSRIKTEDLKVMKIIRSPTSQYYFIWNLFLLE